ncbi:MAG: phosphate acetyltransferase [Opitutaceae bacterium]
MPLIESLVEKLQRHPKRFVFPEGSDPRIMQAARQIVSRQMGVPILLGDRSAIKQTAARLSINLSGIRLLEPTRSDDFEAFTARYLSLRSAKGVQLDEARQIMADPNFYATMMLAENRVEALISGATRSASSALRPLFQIIPRQPGVQSASSLLVLDFEGKGVGIGGVLFLGDCGVLPEPTATQLADIAVTTATLAHHLTNALPRVAMLSFSTRGSSNHPSVERIREATRLARAKAGVLGFEIAIEGEIQVDAALDAATALNKGVEGPVGGQANVLIFPDLNSGNTASKLVQIMTGANSYGQILTGLSKPAAEISRGASAHDILGAAAIVGCQAIDRVLLYGN